nr:uncharacterized protein LOC102605890 [Ipomoea trifida]
MWSNIFYEKVQKCRSNCEGLAAINYRLEKQIQYHDTKATYLAMFYITFQFILFLANSKPSEYQCKHWWKLFSVSILISVLFGINFISTILNCVRIRKAQDMNWLYQSENYRQMGHLERHKESYHSNIQLRPEAMTSAEQEKTYYQMLGIGRQTLHTNEENRESAATTVEDFQPTSAHQRNLDTFTVYQRYVHVGVTVSLLLAYTVLVLHACRSSLCNGKA